MDIKAYMSAHREEILADILHFVECQSPSADKAVADACADYLEKLFLDRLGVTPDTVYPAENCGRHLFYRIGSGEKKAFFIGHFDTVWNIDALPIKREENRLYGPGVFDMKTGIVMGIWALKSLKDAGELDGEYGFFLNSDEEIGSTHSRLYYKAPALEYPCAIILEPAAGGKLKITRKGIGMFYIDIDGIPAHAGADFYKGRSAILEASRVTEQLFAMNDKETGVTVNVGVINGGSKRNVVAAHASMEIDVRVQTMEQADDITKKIYALQPSQDGVTLHIKGGLNRPPMEFTEGNRRLFALAQQAAKEIGMTVEGAAVGGGSDGSFTSSWGIPTLDSIGAIGDGAHADHEHIVIDETIDRLVLLTHLITKL